MVDLIESCGCYLSQLFLFNAWANKEDCAGAEEAFVSCGCCSAHKEHAPVAQHGLWGHAENVCAWCGGQLAHRVRIRCSASPYR